MEGGSVQIFRCSIQYGFIGDGQGTVFIQHTTHLVDTGYVFCSGNDGWYPRADGIWAFLAVSAGTHGLRYPERVQDIMKSVLSDFTSKNSQLFDEFLEFIGNSQTIFTDVFTFSGDKQGCSENVRFFNL